MESIRLLFAVPEAARQEFFPHHPEGILTRTREYWAERDELQERRWDKLLQEFDPEVVISCWQTPGFSDDYASSPNSLRYVCHLAGSVRNRVPRAMIERGVLISNWGNMVGHSVAEHAVLLILAGLRNIREWNDAVDEFSGNPRTRLRTCTLKGKRVGIHGFGGIARHLVSMLRPFHCQISAYSEGVPSHLYVENGVKECGSLAELFSKNQILVECEALTSRTEGSVSANILRKLPDGALLVNVGRASVVEEEALIAEAQTGRIQIALDVFPDEPLRPDSPLRKIPGAVLSPHIAGPTFDMLPDCGAFALRNLKRYIEGREDEIEGRVTLEIFDRST